jgi:D-hexose-6-phosphate mutarotase
MDGRGELPMMEVETAWSTAEIYLHGAHVTHFKTNGQPPLLFLSQCSRFSENQPIRGGIPIIFPWFGSREGMGQHGFARVKAWELKEFAPAADGSVNIRLRLPECPEASGFPAFSADYVVSVSKSLSLELRVRNDSASEEFSFENCLHTYFAVGDIKEAAIHGLNGVSYLDKTSNFSQKTETEEAIRITSEVDRVYMNTTGMVEIVDRALGRRIRIEKEGSLSTVVWNPWVNKSLQMPDFGTEEYEHMVCVESGNVGADGLHLGPGEQARLRVKLTSVPL